MKFLVVNEDTDDLHGTYFKTWTDDVILDGMT